MTFSLHRPSVIQGSFLGDGPRFPIPHHRTGAVQLAPAHGPAMQIPPALLQLRPHAAGQRLPEAIQKKMEAVFGTDFSDVRVHVGSEASSIGALAFAHGSDVYFAHGQYNPNTSHGQRLIGHELAHVVQQRSGRVRNPFGSGLAVVQDPGLEAEAERMGIKTSFTSISASLPTAEPPSQRPGQSIQAFLPLGTALWGLAAVTGLATATYNAYKYRMPLAAGWYPDVTYKNHEGVIYELNDSSNYKLGELGLKGKTLNNLRTHVWNQEFSSEEEFRQALKRADYRLNAKEMKKILAIAKNDRPAKSINEALQLGRKRLKAGTTEFNAYMKAKKHQFKWVVTKKDRELYIIQHGGGGDVKHTAASLGEDVLAAGFGGWDEKGNLLIDDDSGHYHPSFESVNRWGLAAWNWYGYWPTLRKRKGS